MYRFLTMAAKVDLKLKKDFLEDLETTEKFTDLKK